MAKEFNKKFMHPTRRKLVNMVLTGGEYEKNTTISLVDAKDTSIKREVGETWVDNNGVQWEQKEWGREQVSSLTEVMSNTRAYLDELNKCKSPTCKTVKKSRVDKKLISKTGYCLHCVSIREGKIKTDGLWKEYEDYKIYSNMVHEGREIVEKLNQAYKEVKQEYEYVLEDGRVEKWRMERPAEDLKAEIMIDIVKIEGEIEQVIKLRNEAWEKIKDMNYDLVKPPVDL